MQDMRRDREGARVTNPQTYGWNWGTFHGSREGLALNHRDLASLDTVLTLVRGRTAVVQAGGNLGLFPKRLAQEFATVYTFEPAASLFAMLQHNAPELNIVKFQAAVGDVRGLVGTACVRREGKTRAAHEGITHIVKNGVVPTLRIDDLALPVCDLIYLDVEGWELYAIRGAVETIARCRPIVVVEINQNAAIVGFAPETLRAEILAHAYRAATRVLSDEVFVPLEVAA